MSPTPADAPAGPPGAVMLAASLMLVAGAADAGGWLIGEQVFTLNQAGNFIKLAIALADPGSVDAVGPSLSVAVFFAGAALTALVLRRAPRGFTWHTATVLAVVGAVLVVTGGYALGTPDPTDGARRVINAVMSTAMGGLALTQIRLAVPGLSSLGVTGNLVAVAEQAGNGGWRAVEPRRVTALLLVLVGATGAAAVHRQSPGWSVILPGLWCLAVGGYAFVRRPAHSPQRR